MPLSRPLLVAAVAGVLLVVSIGVDASVNRTFALDVRQDGGWREVASSSGTMVARPMSDAVSAADGNVTFRLRIDNGFPWPASEAWSAHVDGIEYAHGTLDAPSRGTGEVVFDVPMKAFRDSGPTPAPKAGNVTFGSVDVEVGGKTLYAGLTIQEAS